MRKTHQRLQSMGSSPAATRAALHLEKHRLVMNGVAVFVAPAINELVNE